MRLLNWHHRSRHSLPTARIRRESVPASRPGQAAGQALVEYVLILALIAIAMGAGLALTGPAIGNIFQNVVVATITGGDPFAIPLSTRGGAPVSFWQTVEWVRNNPQGETPFPTPINLPATAISGNVNTPTPSHTYTRTPTNTYTPSLTPTLTPTSTNTATPGPSPTPADIVYSLPYVDQGRAGNGQSQSETGDNWRVDLPGDTGVWAVQYYDSCTNCTNKSTFALTAPRNTASVSTISIVNGTIPAGSGVDGSAGGSVNDNWGAVYTRSFTAVRPMTITFTVPGNTLDDTVRLVEVTAGNAVRFSQTYTENHASGGTSISHTATLAAGQTSTFRVDFAQGGGGYEFTFNTTISPRANPDDAVVAGLPGCGWQGGNNNIRSSSPNLFYYETNSDNGSFPNGRTCYFELRGYIDVPAGSNPQMTFWDMWALPAGVTANLQVAAYIPDAFSGMDRAATTWTTVPLRSAGTSNYNWTRTQIDLDQVFATVPNRLTFRFVLASSAAASNVRYYLDDIQVTAQTTAPPNFTINSEWNADSRSQMEEFFFNADTSYTAESSARVPQGWRWNIGAPGAGVTGASGSVWGLSGLPVSSLSATATDTRTHFLELARPVDLTSAPATDSEGDFGPPILSFWYAYALNQPGTGVRVQYSRSPQARTGANANAAETWTAIDSGVILSPTTCTAACLPNEQNTRTVNGMLPISVLLDTIPNWNTQPFRLRIAVVTNGGATLDSTAGVWIDRLRIERDTNSPYANFPFNDSAEDAAFTSVNWVGTNSWAAATAGGGAFNTASYYADSPGGNSPASTTTTFSMRRTIDLLRDTPANTGATYPVPVNPYLTFHFTRVSTGGNFYVDVWTAKTNSWQPVWNYANNGPQTNLAFERVDIDLRSAVVESLQAATGNGAWQWSGATATSVTGNGAGEVTDDDIRIRFRVIAPGSPGAGFDVDEISIYDRPANVHRLWDAPLTTPITVSGDGSYVDRVESRYPTSTTAGLWSNRWLRSGSWGATTPARSGSQALQDSPSGNYGPDERLIVEFAPIIDLRGMLSSERPMFDFFTQYNIASGDLMTIQVATENTTYVNQIQDYGRLIGWNAWTDINFVVNEGTGTQLTSGTINSWHRVRADLSAYAGPNATTAGQRIRLRLRFRSDNNGSQGNGIAIDDAQLTFGRSTITTPYTVDPSDLSDWVLEGSWGVTTQYAPPASTVTLSGGSWAGYYYDCELSAFKGTDNCDAAGMNAILGRIIASTSPQPTTTTGPANSRIGPDGTGPINRTFTNSNRPNWTGQTEYNSTYMGRFIRQVNIPVGSYTFSTIANDGFRVYLASDPFGRVIDNSGTDLAAGTHISNNWTVSAATRQENRSFTVTSAITGRYLVFEYFDDNGSNDTTYLDFITSLASTTAVLADSPSTQVGNSFTTVNTPTYTYAAFTLNGVFNAILNPNIYYQRRFSLRSGQRLRLQYSGNGGYTWSDASGEWAENYSVASWETRTFNIPSVDRTAAMSIRFLSDNLSAGGTTGNDGAFISDIRIGP